MRLNWNKTNKAMENKIEKILKPINKLQWTWFCFECGTPKNEWGKDKCKHYALYDRLWIKIEQKLEHLAKQKDEEFMGIIGEDEEIPTQEAVQKFIDKHKLGVSILDAYPEMVTPVHARNALKAELRNKLQKGKDGK